MNESKQVSLPKLSSLPDFFVALYVPFRTSNASSHNDFMVQSSDGSAAISPDSILQTDCRWLPELLLYYEDSDADAVLLTYPIPIIVKCKLHPVAVAESVFNLKSQKMVSTPDFYRGKLNKS